MKVKFTKQFMCIDIVKDGIDVLIEAGQTAEFDRDESARWLINNGFAEEVKESGWWKPGYCERYYTVRSDGDVISLVWLEGRFDEGSQAIGNVFKTEESAQAYADYLEAIATVRQDDGVLTPDDVRKTLARDGTVYTIGINCTMLSVERFYNTSAGAVYFDTGYNAKASLDKHPDEWETIANYDWSRE